MVHDSMDKAFKDWKMQIWLGQQSYEQGKYVVAEEKFKRALKDLEEAMIHDERLSMTLNNLALCYCAQGKHRDADPLYQKALLTDQSSGGANKLMLAEDYHNIARHYRKQGMNAQAEELYKRALAIYEEKGGADCPDKAGCLDGLGIVYSDNGRTDEAIACFNKALAIKGVAFGTKSKEYAETLVNLAITYCNLNRCEEADPLFEKGVRILEYSMYPMHEELIDVMEAYLAHLKKRGNTEKIQEVASDIEGFKKRRTKTIY